MSHIVLGIIGLPAAGKGTIAAYLQEKHGAAKLRFSDALHGILERLDVDRTRDNLIKLSEVIRETCGEDVLARAMLIGVERASSDIVVIDGVRREADIVLFRENPNFHLVGVTADMRVRYERSKLRAEKPEEANQTFEDFAALEQRSTEVSTRELLEKAEQTIDNNGTMEELYKNVDAYLKMLVEPARP